MSFKFSCDIPGDPVTKKNNLRPSGPGKRPHNDPAVKRAIDAMQFVLRAKWAKLGLPPDQRMTRASLWLVFFPSNLRHDLDGGATTIIDALVKADILYNDSMAHLVEERVRIGLVKPKREAYCFVELWGELTTKKAKAK
jgi:hypothetical protein